MSCSSLRHKITLAQRCEVLPELGDAVRHGTIGYEAAQIVGRIATPDNVPAWIARAQARTVVQLREEVEAVQMQTRVDHPELPSEASGRIDRRACTEPPSAEVLEDVAAFKRGVHSGEFFEAALASAPGGQISVTAGGGRTIRLWVCGEQLAQWNALHR